MTLLHDYFNVPNQQAFQRLLSASIEAASASGSGISRSPSSSYSWKKTSSLASSAAASLLVDVNARDSLGRTILHLACSAPALECTEYVRLLLKHPQINVNLPDLESHWTALHRALYNGNIASALLLLHHPDIDPKAKDWEGYTPFDLYNSTVQGTKPIAINSKYSLYTWGCNRNASLGHGDASDRTYPDPVNITMSPSKQAQLTENSPIKARFAVHHVKGIAMSKLHTVVVTDEPVGESNLRVCGLGNMGRLGTTQHMQYSLIPFGGTATNVITRVAVGQDYTVALTNTGEVLSWGSNRFCQLGYVIETANQSSRAESDQIQPTPRRVLGSLKKEIMVGIAASKCAACSWNAAGELYTWGTNHGQLGYDHNAHPIQVQPRKASRISKPILDVAMTESAMLCLLKSFEVICVWRDMHFKINFPSLAFPKPMAPYRPPPASHLNRSDITKVVANDEGSFAALTSSGEVFTLSVPQQTDSSLTKEDIKPQQAWALRKQFTSVKDVALGTEGSIILCTESGHVFVRDRSSLAKKNIWTGKWTRVPYIQRVVSVAANSTGSLSALREDFTPRPIEIVGNTLQDGMAYVTPFLWLPLPSDSISFRSPESAAKFYHTLQKDRTYLSSEDEDLAIITDVQIVSSLARYLSYARSSTQEFPPLTDISVTVDSVRIPAHRVILAARSRVLKNILHSRKVSFERDPNLSLKYKTRGSAGLPSLVFGQVQPFTVLLLLFFLYVDDIPAIWDLRILSLSEPVLSSSKIRGGPAAVKQELVRLATLLELPSLLEALGYPSKKVPQATLATDLAAVFENAQSPEDPQHFFADVILHLQDRSVATHSLLLRARSPFFSAFFEDPVWVDPRRHASNGKLEVDLRHLRWHSMQYVLRFLACGEEDMFYVIPFAHNVDDIIELMFEIMSAANELLLDRLISICSQVVLDHLTLSNACYILTDASYFNAPSLVDRVQHFLAVNLETFLESNLLLDLSPYVVTQLSRFVRKQQSNKMGLHRMLDIISVAMEKHAKWLSEEDFPEPILPSHHRAKAKNSPRLSPKLGRKQSTSQMPPPSPIQLPSRPHVPDQTLDDDVFLMDDAEPHNIATSSSSALAWKSTPNPRVDMKSVMEEAAGVSVSPGSLPSFGLKFSQRPSQRDRKKAQAMSVTPPTAAPGRMPAQAASSPWKPIPQPTPLPIPSSDSAPSLTPPAAPQHSCSPSTPNKSRSQPIPGSSSAKSSPSQLGPVFTPSRQATSKDPRRVHSGAGPAWTLPPVRPSVTPATTSGISLVAIQQQELEESVPKKVASLSLVDIQREETDRQLEQDFLKWWADEEARVRGEAERATVNDHDQPSKKGNRRKKAPGLRSGKGKEIQPTGNQPSPSRSKRTKTSSETS